MLPPDFPLLDGKAAIQEYVAGAANIPGFQIRWEPLAAHVSNDGDMAYMLERNVTEVDGPEETTAARPYAVNPDDRIGN